MGKNNLIKSLRIIQREMNLMKKTPCYCTVGQIWMKITKIQYIDQVMIIHEIQKPKDKNS